MLVQTDCGIYLSAETTSHHRIEECIKLAFFIELVYSKINTTEGTIVHSNNYQRLL